MSKKIIIIILIIVAVVAGLIASVFWYQITNFYKDCERIKVGMSTEEVESILSPYINSHKFDYSRDGALWGPGLYVSSNTSGNQCNVRFREGKVDDVEARFE